MHRLGIVGCGITGAVTAMLLKQSMPYLNIVILEKSKGTGGRMSTSRSSFGSTVDLGAQFITKSSNLTSTQEKLYNHLFEDGILQPMPENVEGLRSTPSAVGHFICPSGSGSLVKYFLKKAGDCEILFGHKVTKINPSNEKWETFCENGASHSFDAVILTIPVPQILQLDDIKSHLESNHIEKLKAVKYCSRYALGFFYDDEPSFFKDVSWCAKFINDDIIRYCAIDVIKRKSTGLPSVVFHTSKEFGMSYIDESANIVQDLIAKRIEELFPQMPKPTEIKFHKWRYSQVEQKYCGEACLVVSKKPPFIFGGDGFSNSNFENCALSAEQISRKIMELVHQ